MKYMTALLFYVFSSSAHAAWVDTTGKVENIVTYAHTETILVELSVPGFDVQECANKGSFAISKDMSAEGRARMYSMLLAAQASGRLVTVAVSNTGGCEPWDSTPNVYRKIARMR